MQDYKLVQRALVGGPSVIVDGVMLAQNYSEFMSYLNEAYLRQGYKVLDAPTLLKYTPGNPETGAQATTEWAYHLVKEVNTEPEKSKKE